MAVLEGDRAGRFVLQEARSVFGILHVSGRRSTLELYDDADFPQDPDVYSTIQGQLHDGTSVTLFNCVLLSINRTGSVDQKKCSARTFTNTIIFGPRCIVPDASEVLECSFSFGDSASVFYDFDAFASIIEPRPFLPLLVADKAHIRTPALGKRPIIGYFSGKFEIAGTETVHGRVEVGHRISEKMGGPKGWAVSGQIWVTIKFDSPLYLEKALGRVHLLIRFFELVCGRKQNIVGVEARTKQQSATDKAFEVYEAHAERTSFSDDLSGRRDPGPRDVLICTMEESTTFERVLAKYIERDDEWRESRSRLADSLRRSNSFTVDRLVAAANMFDILPDSACIIDGALSEEEKKARDIAKHLFASLPSSIDRDSVLGAIGRMGKPSLKKKILSRVSIARIGERFKGIENILKEAVNCRNHYVHGSRVSIDYSENFDMVVFYTLALEFVFGASDLIECGWDINRWLSEHPQAEHPFGEFLHGYKERRSKFLKLFPSAEVG